jgi:hypothetical protein
MKSLSVLLILLLPAILTWAQKPDKPGAFPWKMEQSLYTSDSTGVASLTYSGDKTGLAFINQDGVLEKELPLPCNTIGIGKWNGDIIAFYINEFDYRSVTRQIHAVLIDAKTKSILADKVVYNNPGDNMLSWEMGNDDRGNFAHLLIRVTGQDKAPGRTLDEKEQQQMDETTAMSILSLSDDLKPTLKPLASAAIGGIFFDNYTNTRGEATIVSYANDRLVAERFGTDGQLLKRIETPIDYAYLYFDWNDSRRGRLDPGTGDTLTFSMAHTDHRKKSSLLSLLVFDLKDGKTLFQQTSQLNKEYLQQCCDSLPLVRSKHFKPIQYLKPDGIIYVGDKLVVFNEIRYNWSMPQNGVSLRFDSEGVIVNFYNNKYHLLRQLFLDRFYECYFNMGRGLSYCIRDGRILAFGNEQPHAFGYGSFCYSIDPETFTAEKRRLEWGDIPKTSPVDLNTLFWFRNTIVNNHNSNEYMFGSHLNSYLGKVDY